MRYAIRYFLPSPQTGPSIGSLVVLDKLTVFLSGQRIVERLQVGFFADEIPGIFLPRIQYLRLLHLFQRLTLIQSVLHDRASFSQHLQKDSHVAHAADVTVSWNHLHIRRKLGAHRFQRTNHAIDVAAGSYVDEGEAIRSEVVSHVYDIRLGKEDDGVAVGVPGWKVERADVLAIQVDRNIVVECDDGQRFFRLGLGVETHRAAIAGNSAALQSLAYIVVRNDGCF